MLSSDAHLTHIPLPVVLADAAESPVPATAHNLNKDKYGYCLSGVFGWTGFAWNNVKSWVEIIKFHTEFPSTARPMTETPFPCGRPCTYICVNIIIAMKVNIHYTLSLLKKKLKPDKEDFQSFCPKQTPHHPHCFLRRNQNADCKIQLWSICIEFMQGVFLSPPPFTLP